MPELLINVTRGPIVESIHRGDIAVVDRKGNLLYSKGDPYKVTYLRSALKPIQALNVFLSGADKKFHFSDEEISLMCASHYGEDFHRRTVDSILSKLGLDLGNLLCGSNYSLMPEYMREQIASHVKLTPANTDCSGKHSGMLAACITKGYSIDGYNSPEHPVQKDIKREIADICEFDEEKIIIGIDGCSVPVHAMPLYNAALGFAKLAQPEDLDEEVKNACERIFTAMNNAPEMVAGTGGFCTELIKNTHGKLIGKIGAEGVYCIGLKQEGIGIAVKIEDGNFNRAVAPAVMRCLDDLGILDSSESDALMPFRKSNIYNNVRDIIGEIRADFHLEERK
ncbi:MAG: asparaginase [Clostridiaceae bacterium]